MDMYSDGGISSSASYMYPYCQNVWHSMSYLVSFKFVSISSHSTELEYITYIAVSVKSSCSV